MYDFKKIKLIIWDLDETFWNGVLSEGEVTIPEDNIFLVKQLTDIGIVNSICSKNDFSQVQDRLEEAGLWELFVFPSVDWSPKGGRIRQMIADMNLRPVNVLFIDDNPSNLEEAKSFCPELMTAIPADLVALLEQAKSVQVSDLEHKRLRQYQVLEKKRDQRQTFSSNEEFLYDSNIQVEFGTNCEENLTRIHDLVWRSNQLNFTKIRSTQEELRELFSRENYQCGYVSVKDKFGDYGIAGFYAINTEEKKLLHFCFSCRTLGMGIEQYVYNYLGRPELKIEGEVISSLETEQLPGWINQNLDDQTDQTERTKSASSSNATHRVLIKGPCDLFQILPYISDKSSIDTEFTYVNKNGVTIESTGHTTHIVEAKRLSKAEKKRVLSEVPFSDEGIYNDNIYRKGYKVVIISILTDANLGVYRRKGTGERIAFVEGYHPITDPANWDAYINGEYNCSSVTFTKEMLQQFAEKYEFVGINTPEQIVANLRYIKEHLPSDCVLAVMLGGELYYEKNTFPAYENRHIVHREINNAIRASAKEIGLELIDVNKYLVDQSSFYDHFNHYIKPVYYKLAGDIVELINRQTGQEVKETGKLKMVQVRLKEFLAPYYYKVRKIGKTQ